MYAISSDHSRLHFAKQDICDSKCSSASVSILSQITAKIGVQKTVILILKFQHARIYISFTKAPFTTYKFKTNNLHSMKANRVTTNR